MLGLKGASTTNFGLSFPRLNRTMLGLKARRRISKLCQEGTLVGQRTSKRGYWRFRNEERNKALKKSMPQDEMEVLMALTATTDPVLAEIWDNQMEQAGNLEKLYQSLLKLGFKQLLDYVYAKYPQFAVESKRKGARNP
ncbi:MAG: hypothetical protein ABIM59_05495 [candidate division WOR-3 bacterium]